MATYNAIVKKVEPNQPKITTKEHCSADPDALKKVGRSLGEQVRIIKPASGGNPREYALYTVKEIRQEGTDDIVRMRKDGLERLDPVLEEFPATLDSQVPHPDPDFTDEQAKAASEFVERLRDNGLNAGLIAIAPLRLPGQVHEHRGLPPGQPRRSA